MEAMLSHVYHSNSKLFEDIFSLATSRSGCEAKTRRLLSEGMFSFYRQKTTDLPEGRISDDCDYLCDKKAYFVKK
jgi:hypothetical protein